MDILELAGELSGNPTATLLFCIIIIIIGVFLYFRMYTNAQAKIVQSYIEMATANRDLTHKTTAEVFDLNAYTRKLNDDIKALNDRLRESEERQNILEDERTDLIKEREKLIGYIRRLINKAKDDDGRIKRLESELDTANKKIEDLERRLKNYETGELEDTDIL